MPKEKKEPEEIRPSRKKMLGVLAFLGLLVVAGLYQKDLLVLGSMEKKERVEERVKVNTNADQSALPATYLQKKLETLKKEVASLTVEDIASASPELQKIVNELKSLESYPKNQAKEICQKICSDL